MSAVRAELAAALSAGLDKAVKVLPYARNIDTPTATTVMLRQDSVEPSPVTPTVRRRYTYTVVVIAAITTDTGPADDALDAALEDVLDVIDASDLMTWTAATRGVWLDTTHPAYEVTVQTYYTKEA